MRLSLALSECSALWESVGIVLIVVVVSGVIVVLCGCKVIEPDYPTTNPMTPPATSIQLDPAEALATIEFCVDLDSQDDRQTSPRNIYKLRGDRIKDWTLVENSRQDYAKAKGLSAAEAVNPDYNGFSPFKGAWTLWELNAESKSTPKTFCLAFRGTVFSSRPSVVEDALATTVAGRRGLELKPNGYLNVSFSELPRAEVHEGFAYGLFCELFDKDFGVLPAIKEKVPPGSTLIITGHSQGAALATLAHAFFFYAERDRLFGIQDLNLTLRSYVYAQPKPGNLQFALDFARVTGGGANSFTFNNTLDSVPMLAPTHSFLFGAFEDCPAGKNRGFELIRAVNNAGNRINRTLSSFVEGETANAVKKTQKRDKETFYLADQLKAPEGFVPESAVSQDYICAGNIIPLVGLYDGSLYYGYAADDQGDEFIQHHSSTYRRLLETMFGYDRTTETTKELVMPPAVGSSTGKPVAK